jgi:hypothetical protein
VGDPPEDCAVRAVVLRHGDERVTRYVLVPHAQPELVPVGLEILVGVALVAGREELRGRDEVVGSGRGRSARPTRAPTTTPVAPRVLALLGRRGGRRSSSAPYGAVPVAPAVDGNLGGACWSTAAGAEGVGRPSPGAHRCGSHRWRVRVQRVALGPQPRPSRGSTRAQCRAITSVGRRVSLPAPVTVTSGRATVTRGRVRERART